jgi:hypothetical protein
MGALWAAAFSLVIIGVSAQSAPDPWKLLQEADRKWIQQQIDVILLSGRVPVVTLTPGMQVWIPKMR